MPPSRRLLASTAALLLLLTLTGVLYLARDRLGAWTTPLGRIAVGDLFAVALSMFAGGAIARSGFRAIAVGLVLLIGVTTAITAWAYAPPTQANTVPWLVRNIALQAVVSAAVAWLAAHAGQRLAVRRAS